MLAVLFGFSGTKNTFVNIEIKNKHSKIILNKVSPKCRNTKD